MMMAAKTLAIWLFVMASAVGEGRAQVPLSPIGGAATGERVDYGWRIRPIGEMPIELGEYRGKVLFINAWASWCTPCIREMASIEQLAALLADTDVAFLLVAVERETSVRRHLRRYRLSLPVYLEEQRFPRAFGLRGIPMTWIVDREGGIALRHYGATDWATPAVEAFLRELANSPPP